MAISKGCSKKEEIGQTIFNFQKGLRNEFQNKKLWSPTKKYFTGLEWLITMLKTDVKKQDGI